MAQGANNDRKDMTPSGLLALARSKARESRRERRVFAAAILDGADAALTDRQRATLSRLLRQLVAEVETAIRIRIEGALDPAAHDDALSAEIATPGGERLFATLAEAGVLDGGPVIEAVVHRLFQHQLERAMRTPARDGWLGDSGQLEPDLGGLLGLTPGSPLHRLIASYQVERNLRKDSYGEPVLPLREMAPRVCTRLFWTIAAALGDRLRGGGAVGMVDEAVQGAATTALEEISGGPAGGHARALVRELGEAGLLRAEAAVRVLRAGEVPLFEALLGTLSNLRPTLLRRLLYETGGEGLAILARAVELPEPVFADLYSLTRHARGRPLADPTGALERLNAFRLEIPIESARAVLTYWRSAPDYLAARWRLEAGRRAADAEECG